MNQKLKTILVVDDDTDMVKLLSKILTTGGFKVLTASSVAEAKPLLDSEPPHLILTDLHMTPESGFDFIQYLKGNKQYSAIPVLVLSALNDFTSVKKAIALGVNDYVIKPLQSQMLIRKLRKALLNKDFASWEVPKSQNISVDVSLTVEVTALGDSGCILTAPFKVTKGKEIKVSCFEFSSMGLDKVVMRSNVEHKIYQQGMFLNDITFVGVTDSEVTKIRQFINKRNAQ